MTYEEEVKCFEEIVQEMLNTFKRKRADYGPSTTDTWKLYGPVSMMTRLRDKINRLDNLLVRNREPLVTNESVVDTLYDLANYAIITCIELVKERENLKKDCVNETYQCPIHNC